METELFVCESQEQIDDYIFAYYRCTLKQTVGKWQKGTMIPVIGINLYNGDMQFISDSQNGNIMSEHKVTLSVK